MIVRDGPAHHNFRTLALEGPWQGMEALKACEALSPELRSALEQAPTGACVSWGIPFDIEGFLPLYGEPATLRCAPTTARWLVFQHTSDIRPLKPNKYGFVSPTRGWGQLGELAARYTVLYEDGSEEEIPIRRRHEIGAFQRPWGENCFQAVAHCKPRPQRPHHEQTALSWGVSQTRVDAADDGPWVNWLYAWNNPHPEKAIVGLRCEPGEGAVLLMAVSLGDVREHPLRWRPRRKATLTLPEGLTFDPTLDEMGLLSQIRLDLGQIISAQWRPIYLTRAWGDSYNNQLPVINRREVILEYTAHPEATFHLWNGERVPVSQVEEAQAVYLKAVPPATQRVLLRVVEKGSRKPVAVKLHVHGQAGEYLAPVDRHRIPNPCWFEDYSVDFTHRGQHHCTYIPGETVIDLPLGPVYLEVSKGFEIKPLRLVREVTPETKEIVIELDKVLPWRERGWVSADTHVHFLTPMSALLEGSAEGVNVVNLLASQWGELVTNVGDFDGKTTWGSVEAGGDGEYLVRVGTENRQHVLGHISLLGYEGRIIAPMTTGGPDESALGDPIEVLLTEWARQCREQGGLVILPHFPNPRAENAAAIVEGVVDGVEMTSWDDLYSGINPYSLSDWYRYLNNGYMVAAVGGTDKMTARTAVGTVRTYARLREGEPFTYRAWMEAIRRAETFVTYGPLMEMTVDGKPMGARIPMTSSGGTVDVAWEVASVTVPMSRIELIVNGEIRESLAIDPWAARGSFRVPISRSSWIALLVRGHYTDKPEIIAAHSTPVMVEVEGSPFYAAADAVTILEQIEGALAYLDTVGTRAETRAYKRMRLILEGAHRRLHNRMHQMGHYHEHTPPHDHAAHHR
ncbi:MAG: CehA/McbA family metallohydrolase [Chloroflexi bacterium]|nr:CehA/McbA family metallohydrolase [Chloroflexota bacterium]